MLARWVIPHTYHAHNLIQLQLFRLHEAFNYHADGDQIQVSRLFGLDTFL